MDPNWNRFQSEAGTTEEMFTSWFENSDEEKLTEQLSFLFLNMLLCRGENLFEKERCLAFYSSLLEQDYDHHDFYRWRSEFCGRLAGIRTDERYLLQSIEDYERRIELGADVLGERGQIRLALGWLDDAIADLTAANTASGKYDSYLEDLAKACIEAGRLESAIDLLSQRIDPSSQKFNRSFRDVALALRSRAYDTNGDPGRCEEDRNQLWEHCRQQRDSLDPFRIADIANEFELYLRINLRAGNYRYVIDEIEARLDDKDISIRRRLLSLKARALSQQAGNQYDELLAKKAADSLQEAVSINPDCGAAWREYIEELEKQWAWEDLIQLSTGRSGRDCTDTIADGCMHSSWSLHGVLNDKEPYWRGRSAALSDQLEEATKYFEQRPRSSHSMMELCVCRYKLGEFDQLQAVFESL